MNLKRKLEIWKSLTAGLMFIVACCFVFQGCEKEEDKLLDKDILNSSELEEYIVAGADLQHSLAVFKSSLNKIDFSKLNVTYNAEGKKVVYLPSLIGNFRIEEKIQIFNKKKEAIQKEFPQFVTFMEAEAKEYFQKSIENSVNVTGKLLKLGINISTRRLKDGNETWFGAENEVFMYSFLSDWAGSVNYVELYVLYYEDGTFGTYQSPSATSSFSTISYSIRDNKMYFPEGGSTSAVTEIGHTHQNSPYPSDADRNNNYPSTVTPFIYFDGAFHYF